MKNKNRFWLILFGLIAAVSLIFSLLFLHLFQERTVVQIIRAGEVLYEIDLSKVKEAYTIEVEAPDGGINRILVEPGRIRIQEADCPDRVCVHQGWLKDQAYPIVCMPHQLMIRLVNGTREDIPDAVSR